MLTTIKKKTRCFFISLGIKTFKHQNRLCVKKKIPVLISNLCFKMSEFVSKTDQERGEN